MDLTTFATTIGMLELLVGIPLIVFPEETSAWILKAMKDDITIRVIGAILFLLGGLIVFEDPTVNLDLDGLLRLLAWLTAIKGVFYAWHPGWITVEKRQLLSDHNTALLFGVISTAFGILFIAAGSVV